MPRKGERRGGGGGGEGGGPLQGGRGEAALVEGQELTELHLDEVNELLIVNCVDLVEEHHQAGDADLQLPGCPSPVSPGVDTQHFA